MPYFRSFIVGLLTALITSVIWVLFREMAATVEMSRMIAASPEGSGGIAGVVVVTEASVLAAVDRIFLQKGRHNWMLKWAAKAAPNFALN
jgi:hypothetical protein